MDTVAHTRHADPVADRGPMGTTPALTLLPPPEGVSLNTLSVRWRIALDAAQEALRGTGASRSTALPGAEVAERTRRLAREREDVARLLEVTARLEHVRLVRGLTQPSRSKAELGVSESVLACVFDLDGVLAASDDVHFAAWAETLDGFLAARFHSASVHFSHYERLSRQSDYDEHLHGKPRIEGIRAFLASRGLTVPEGTTADPPGLTTMHALAARKNELLRRRLEREGVSAYEGSYRYLEAAAAAGLMCAVVSASANTSAILRRAGLADLIDVRIDGETMQLAHLRAKPAPDTLIAACAEIGVEPGAAAAFETTSAGIAAARSAGFASVVAVTRTGRDAAVRAAGADVVVADLGQLLE
jgi:HAD superfamily hydrolase (TIGR01509 family)